MGTLSLFFFFFFEAVLDLNDILKLEFMNSGPMIVLPLSLGESMLTSILILAIMRMI